MPVCLVFLHTALAGCDAQSRVDRVFDGSTGASLTWDELIARVDDAEVVFLGETHDDAVGHAVQREIYAAAIAECDGPTALSMEMIESPGQPTVDAYLAGEATEETLANDTTAGKWNGWAEWYLPIVNEAQANNQKVIAANAPREFVRIASREGYEHLESLSPADRAQFALPLTFQDAEAYRTRFLETMGAPTSPSTDAEMAVEPTAETDENAHNPHAGPMTYEGGVAIFRSQMVWDATMADRIVQHLDSHGGRVVHLVGQFHTDYQGGTVLELLARRPHTRVLTVSLVPQESSSLKAEHVNRADIVIYTGPKDE